MEFSGSDYSFSSFRDQLSNRLLDARTIVINEALTSAVAGEIAEQIALLDAESTEPVQVLISNAPDGDLVAGLSTFDLLRSITAPVTMIGGGLISGPGVIAFLGGAAERRFAFPHVRFQLDEPRETVNPGRATEIREEADAARERRARVVSILAEATGQSEEQVESDLSARRAFDGDAAVAYGLIERIVESRREIE